MKRVCSRSSPLWGILALCAMLAVVGVLRVPCLFKTLLGVSCPGCGMTHAWLAALRLDLAAAFQHHPLFWAVPVIVLYAGGNGHVFGKIPDHLIPGGLLTAFVILFIVRLL